MFKLKDLMVKLQTLIPQTLLRLKIFLNDVTDHVTVMDLTILTYLIS